MSDPGDETNFVDELIHRTAFAGVQPTSGFVEITTKKHSVWVPVDAQVDPNEEQRELRGLGLLDDHGDKILPTDCPACYDIADGTAAGWNGPLGDYVRCERPRGHDGSHMYVILFDEEERRDVAYRR